MQHAALHSAGQPSSSREGARFLEETTDSALVWAGERAGSGKEPGRGKSLLEGESFGERSRSKTGSQPSMPSEDARERRCTGVGVGVAWLKLAGDGAGGNEGSA